MKTPKVNISESTQDKLIKIGLAVAGFFIAKKALANAAKNSADENLDTDPAAGQARALNAAMNPSGNNWMRSFDTTNTQAIYDTAAQITDLDAVRKYYKAQTSGRDLNDDLTSEIGADGFQKFLALATKGKTGDTKHQTVLQPIPANMWVITKKQAYVRKTPTITNILLLQDNRVKLVEPDKALGATTGKYVYDAKNDVTFIEFFTFDSKNFTKRFFYVAKSQVELITDAEKKKREKSGKVPLEILAGLNGVSDEPQTQAVALRRTPLYNEEFKVIMTVPNNVIVGFPFMTLNTGKNELIKLQTVDGNIRWVNALDVRIENRV